MARTTAMDVLCLCLTRYSTADIKAHLKPILGACSVSIYVYRLMELRLVYLVPVIH